MDQQTHVKTEPGAPAVPSSRPAKHRSDLQTGPLWAAGQVRDAMDLLTDMITKPAFTSPIVLQSVLVVAGMVGSRRPQLLPQLLEAIQALIDIINQPPKASKADVRHPAERGGRVREELRKTAVRILQMILISPSSAAWCGTLATMLHGLGEEGPLEVLRQKAVDDTRTYRQTKKRKRMMLDADTSDQPSTRRLKKDPTTGQYHVQPIQKVDALAAVQSRQTPDQLADLVITTFTAPNSASILKTIPKHAPSERPVLTHPFGTADGSKNGPLPLPLPAHPEAEQKEILMDGEDDAQMAVDSVPPAAAAAASGEDQLMAEAPQQGEEQQPSAVALWAESRQQQQQQQQRAHGAPVSAQPIGADEATALQRLVFDELLGAPLSGSSLSVSSSPRSRQTETDRDVNQVKLGVVFRVVMSGQLPPSSERQLIKRLVQSILKRQTPMEPELVEDTTGDDSGVPVFPPPFAPEQDDEATATTASSGLTPARLSYLQDLIHFKFARDIHTYDTRADTERERERRGLQHDSELLAWVEGGKRPSAVLGWGVGVDGTTDAAAADGGEEGERRVCYGEVVMTVCDTIPKWVDVKQKDFHKSFARLIADLPYVPSGVYGLLYRQALDEQTRLPALMAIFHLLKHKTTTLCRKSAMGVFLRLCFAKDFHCRFRAISLCVSRFYTPPPAPPPAPPQAQQTDADEHPAIAEDFSGVSDWLRPEQGGGGEMHEMEKEMHVGVEAPQPDGDGDVDEGGFGWEDPTVYSGKWTEECAGIMLRSLVKPDEQTGEGRFFAHPIIPCRYIAQLCQEMLDELKDMESESDHTSACMMLYIALCFKRPLLLHAYFHVYTLCTQPEVQQTLNTKLAEVVANLSPTHPELPRLIRGATPANETLVITLLDALSAQSAAKEGGLVLSREMAEAVLSLYRQTQNAQLLVPIVGHLHKSEVLQLLPFVLKLESKDQVKTAFARLLSGAAAAAGGVAAAAGGGEIDRVTAVDLLEAIIRVERDNRENLPIKRISDSLDCCFELRDKIDTKSFPIVMTRILETTELEALPKLFGRLMVLVLREFPTVRDFMVEEILPKLVEKKVWNDRVHWRGFLHCLKDLWPASCPILITLPSSQVEDLLVENPAWRGEFSEYLKRLPSGSVPSQLVHLRQAI